MMNERAHPLLIGIIILLGAIGVVLSYMLYKATEEKQTEITNPLSVVQGTLVASTTNTALPLTATVATSTSTTVTPKRAVSSVSSTLSTSKTTEEPGGRICTANDLTGKASWSSNGTNLTGTLRVRNALQSDCILSKDVIFSIYSGTELATSRNTQRPTQSIVIPRGSEKDIWFTWSNWCGANLSRSAFVRIDLPENRGYLRVPVIDSLGYAQSGNPSCQNRNGNTSIDVWWY